MIGRVADSYQIQIDLGDMSKEIGGLLAHSNNNTDCERTSQQQQQLEERSTHHKNCCRICLVDSKNGKTFDIVDKH